MRLELLVQFLHKENHGASVSQVFESNASDGRNRHKLSNTEKLDYLNAELCLMKLSAKLGLPGAKTRFDDFQAIHQKQAYMIHFVVSGIIQRDLSDSIFGTILICVKGSVSSVPSFAPLRP